jgi:small ligand-binding sensory domain FIST
MPLRFHARSSKSRDLDAALDEVLGPPLPFEGPPDVAFLFVSNHFFAEAARILDELRRRTGARHVAGCGGGGIITDAEEVEQRSAVSVLFASMPGAAIDAFTVDGTRLGDGDAVGPWVEGVAARAGENAGFVLLPDPFTIDVIRLIAEFNLAFPGAVVCGGLASGGPSPGTNVLFAGDRVLHAGAVGLAFGGSVRLRSVVSQGCRPVGRRFVVTRCQENIIHELSGKPALEGIREVMGSLEGKDRDLARRALFVGRATTENKADFHRGDFLIRNLMGIDPRSGSIAVGDQVRRGTTVQFHVRDGETAEEDLRESLGRFKGESDTRPSGALLFSCLGRGEGMYGAPHRDVSAIGAFLGEVPKAGFFCSGEIGPIGGSNFVHGFTLSSCFFEER